MFFVHIINYQLLIHWFKGKRWKAKYYREQPMIKMELTLYRYSFIFRGNQVHSTIISHYKVGEKRKNWIFTEKEILQIHSSLFIYNTVNARIRLQFNGIVLGIVQHMQSSNHFQNAIFKTWVRAQSSNEQWCRRCCVDKGIKFVSIHDSFRSEGNGDDVWKEKLKCITIWNCEKNACGVRYA